MKDDVAILIPAYNPKEELPKLIKNLESNGYKNIIVINDGSKEWKELQAFVIKHAKNEGKGQALKTGFAYCQKHLKNIIGIITVDADGQHKIEDINKIYEKFKQNQSSFILGTRNFNKSEVPFKNRLGNKIMCKIVNTKSHYSIQDTQTGLRAIPMECIKELSTIQGNRFEYETNMLFYFIKKG